MPDKITKQERSLIEQYLKSGKEIQVIPSGKTSIDLSQPQPYGGASPATFQKRLAHSRFIRKRMSGLMAEGKNIDEIAKFMNMSKPNVFYHLRKIKASNDIP